MLSEWVMNFLYKKNIRNIELKWQKKSKNNFMNEITSSHNHTTLTVEFCFWLSFW